MSDGREPGRLLHPGSTALQGLYEPVSGLSEDVLELLAPPRTVADVLADVDDALDLLDRLADPGRRVPAATLSTVYAQLAAALDGVDVDAPARVRVAPARVSSEALVLDAPWLQPLVRADVVPAGGRPDAVADLLDLPLASELVTGRVTSRPVRTVDWADVPGADLAAARLGLVRLAGRVAVHAPLTVSGGSEVPWWPGADVDAVDGTPAAFGRALAWRAGRWPVRAALTEAFAQPDRAAQLAAEDAVG